MDFHELEAAEGMRFTWHTWPTTRAEALRCAVPLGAVVTPIHPVADMPELAYSPLRCVGCGGVLNCFCAVHYRDKTWACCLCLKTNVFPVGRDSVCETNLPAELNPTFNVVEYVSSEPPARPPSFAFVVDTCTTSEQLSLIAKAVADATESLPPDCRVALVTFGASVAVHWLRAKQPQLSTAILLQPGNDGDQSVWQSLVRLAMLRSRDGADLLSLGQRFLSQRLAHISTSSASSDRETMGHQEDLPQQQQDLEEAPQQQSQQQGEKQQQQQQRAQEGERGAAAAGPSWLPSDASKGDWCAPTLVAPVGECHEAFVSRLESLQPDRQPAWHGFRPSRATGAALAAALELLEAAVPAGSPARVVALLSGPCTVGGGAVVDRETADTMRNSHDVLTDQTRHFRRATRFYTKLAHRMLRRRGCSFCLDVFACAADQVGLAEMKPAVEMTGGTMLLADSADSEVFRTTLRRLFRSHENGEFATCYDGFMDVRTSREVRVSDAIGPCAPAASTSASGSSSDGSSSIRNSLDPSPHVGSALAAAAGAAPAGVGSGERVGDVGWGTWGGSKPAASSWKLPSLTPRTALAVLFEVANHDPRRVPPGSSFFVQLATSYLKGDGTRRLRVCTVARRWLDIFSSSGGRGGGGGEFRDEEDEMGLAGSGVPTEVQWGGRSAGEVAVVKELIRGFDQEAAAAVVARVASQKMETQEPEDVLRWLDQMLISFSAKFGQYSPNNPHSFRLSSDLFLLPSFLFHLRRSPFIQVFNHSLDEVVFQRMALSREGVLTSLTMVKPSLIAYSLSSPPKHVSLDSSSLDKADHVLLLDAFFVVVVQHGSAVAQWRKSADDLTQERVRKLLQDPLDDARALAEQRWLQPRIVVCDHNDSLSRFLTSRLYPSGRRGSGAAGGGGAGEEDGGGGEELALTDDISLDAFMRELQILAVQSGGG